MSLLIALSSFLLASSITTASVLPRSPVKVIQGNDDGWYEANIRAMYSSLKAAGYETAISAPALDWSGSSSLEFPPTPLVFKGQFGSIPVGAPAIGPDPNDARITYVNSFPVTAIKYGLGDLSTRLYGGPPDIAITGPNVGSNNGVATQFSGTVGAANEAVKQGIPAIAFSGASGAHRSYTELKNGDHSHVYAELALKITNLVTASKPYLPKNVGLNVNFPVSDASTCSKAADFKFVLSRIFPNPLNNDIPLCGATSLPTESTVASAGKCTVSISGFSGGSKLDIGVADQSFIHDKLSSILTCL